jgi:hypothetical protein
MHSGVARRAERNQVLVRIVAGLAAKLFVVNLKVGDCAARLASPAVATQHLVAEVVVVVGIESQSCMFRSDSSHDAFSVT